MQTSTEKQQHPKLAQIEAYWQHRLNVRLDHARHAGTVVVHPPHLRGTGQLAVHRTGTWCVISADPTLRSQLERAALMRSKQEIITRARLISLLAAQQHALAGARESFAYVDEQKLEASVDADERLCVRTLSELDAPALHALLSQCPPDEVQAADVAVDHPLAVGLWRRGQSLDGPMLAAASLQHHDRNVTDIGIITHPAHRRRGLARQLVRALAQHATEAGSTRALQYRTWERNEASSGLQARLGRVYLTLEPAAIITR